jgi:16S rRNA processing protein RimM
MADQESYFTVGAIAGTHGLHGEVKVLPKTDFPKLRFKQGSKLHLRKEGEPPTRELTILTSRPHKQFWLVSFEDLGGINDVEALKGFQLCVRESDLMHLPKGSYYIHQLIGLHVKADDGRDVGELIEVLTPGANDVYVIKGPLQSRDVLLPAIKECVLQVDLDSQEMLIHLLPGLLEADEDADGRSLSADDRSEE